MNKILDNLATYGLQQNSLKWLLEGSYQPNQYTEDSWPVLDARDLYDDPSYGTNTLQDYLERIDLAWQMMQTYGRVAICCAAGQSRSNAVAIGLLIRHLGMSFDDAWKLVHEKIPDAKIKEQHIPYLKQISPYIQ